MNEMMKQRDEAEGVILDKKGDRWFMGTKLEDHEYVDDGVIYQGEKIEPETAKSPKAKGERRPRRTFKDVQTALREMNESLDTNFWAVETNDGMVVFREQEKVRTFSGESKKIDSVLTWLEGFADGLGTQRVA